LDVPHEIFPEAAGAPATIAALAVLNQQTAWCSANS
jgi:hypothetical protein